MSVRSCPTSVPRARGSRQRCDASARDFSAVAGSVRMASNQRRASGAGIVGDADLERSDEYAWTCDQADSNADRPTGEDRGESNDACTPDTRTTAGQRLASARPSSTRLPSTQIPPARLARRLPRDPISPRSQSFQQHTVAQQGPNVDARIRLDETVAGEMRWVRIVAKTKAANHGSESKRTTAVRQESRGTHALKSFSSHWSAPACISKPTKH